MDKITTDWHFDGTVSVYHKIVIIHQPSDFLSFFSSDLHFVCFPCTCTQWRLKWWEKTHMNSRYKNNRYRYRINTETNKAVVFRSPALRKRNLWKNIRICRGFYTFEFFFYQNFRKCFAYRPTVTLWKKLLNFQKF